MGLECFCSFCSSHTLKLTASLHPTRMANINRRSWGGCLPEIGSGRREVERRGERGLRLHLHTVLAEGHERSSGLLHCFHERVGLERVLAKDAKSFLYCASSLMDEGDDEETSVGMS